MKIHTSGWFDSRDEWVCVKRCIGDYERLLQYEAGDQLGEDVRLKEGQLMCLMVNR